MKPYLLGHTGLMPAYTEVYPPPTADWSPAQGRVACWRRELLSCLLQSPPTSERCALSLERQGQNSQKVETRGQANEPKATGELPSHRSLQVSSDHTHGYRWALTTHTATGKFWSHRRLQVSSDHTDVYRWVPITQAATGGYRWAPITQTMGCKDFRLPVHFRFTWLCGFKVLSQFWDWKRETRKISYILMYTFNLLACRADLSLL